MSKSTLVSRFLKFPFRSSAVVSGVSNLLATVPRLDTRPPFMAYTAMRSRKRPMSVRRRVPFSRVPRPLYNSVKSDNRYRTYTRHTAVTSLPLVAGVLGYYTDVSLFQLYTADIINAWDFFRIKGVTAIITPRIDPGNSGITNNGQVHCYVANDMQAEFTTPSTYTIITQFENQKYQCLVAGKSMYYKFYPKVKSTLDNAGTATGVGAPGKFNDWIALNNAGLNIPHHRFLMFLSTSLAASTQTIDVVYRITFDCRGQS